MRWGSPSAVPRDGQQARSGLYRRGAETLTSANPRTASTALPNTRFRRVRHQRESPRVTTVVRH